MDAFFVLSGYLITALLLAEHRATGGIDLRAFWVRRARRLLPALLAVLAATAVFAAVVAEPAARHGIRLDALAALAYVANWRMLAAGGGYFDRLALPSPLQHTWSLGIEEQFYLLWPLVVVLALRLRRGLAVLLAVAAGGAAASAVVMAVRYVPGADPSRVYYGTDTRAQTILAGATVAVLMASRPGRQLTARARAAAGAGVRLRWLTLVQRGAVAAAAVLAIGWLTLTGGDGRLYRGGFAAVAAAVALVLAAVAVAPGSALPRLLRFAPLVAVGRVSYGLYLWHWPIYQVLTAGRTGLQGAGLLLARLAVTGVVATASFVALEQPVRRGRLLGRRPGALLPAAVTAVVVALFLATVTPAGRPAPAAAGAAVTVPKTAPNPATADPARQSAGPARQAAGRRPARPPGQPAAVLVLGDSVALTLTDGLPPQPGVRVVNGATLGCGIVRGGPYRYFGAEHPALPECQIWPQAWSDAVTTNDPDVVVVLVGRWEVMDRMSEGRYTHLGDPAFDSALLADLEQAVTVAGARGAAVALCTAPYYHRGERPDGGSWVEDDPARVDHWNDLVRQVAARHPGTVHLVDLKAKMSPGSQYARVVDGVPMRYDGVHVTPQGSRWLAPWLVPQLAALAGPG